MGSGSQSCQSIVLLTFSEGPDERDSGRGSPTRGGVTVSVETFYIHLTHRGSDFWKTLLRNKTGHSRDALGTGAETGGEGREKGKEGDEDGTERKTNTVRTGTGPRKREREEGGQGNGNESGRTKVEFVGKASLRKGLTPRISS